MISVIVPVYNVAPFLKDCIESIRSQTYINLEIILVDDGSTDSSGKLCDEYMQIDSRIKVIHQKNQGLSAARNTGIEYAKGEFYVFIDSDDRIHRTTLQVMYTAMQRSNAELVICSHKMIQETEHTKPSSKDIFIEGKEEILTGRECIRRIYATSISAEEKVDMTVAWNKLYKRSMFCHLRYPTGRLHEDEFVTYKVLYPLTKVLYIKSPLYDYRIRAGSIMASESANRLKDKMDAFEEKCVYFEQKEDRDLYNEALRRYETSIAELILFLEEKKVEKNLQHELGSRFRLVYKEKIAVSNIPFRHKMKYMLFMKNKRLYKILKNISY